MNWLLLILTVASAAVSLMLWIARRNARSAEIELFDERALARETGSNKARLQHPHVDLSVCMGCGTCVQACPEEGVLAIRHGQATVVHGARCVGHARCAEACPVDAISITLEGLDSRRDIPALTHELECVGRPGLFIAGELGGFALVRTALSQGAAVGAEVGRRVLAAPRRKVARPARVLVGAGGAGPSEDSPEPSEPLDLLIVGAGPAGIACALAAKEAGIRFAIIDQAEEIGGTVASYPRRKLVMTQPIELPLGARLDRLTYEKEDLVALWDDLVRTHALPVRTGVRFEGVDKRDDAWAVATSLGHLTAHNVCLALGRRGTPRKLGVPGEDLPKVAYSLIDAQSYQHRNLLVVGGGDSAIEAAVGLSEQPGNQVTLSYRKHAFFRLKARNARNIEQAVTDGRVTVRFESQVVAVEEDAVRIRCGEREEWIANDEVFVFAGGIAPFGLLEKSGVSFDPKDRPPVEPLVDRGTGLVMAASGVALAVAALLAWVWSFQEYYATEPRLRPTAADHELLGPRGTVGLWTALVACGLFAWNLLYLARRSRWIGSWLRGNLTTWLSIHMLTGFVGWLLIVVHAGVYAANTTGGHAFVALTIVVATGAIGRYLYSYVPRAANGAEAGLEELRGQIAALSGEWDRAGTGFAEEVRDRAERALRESRHHRGFFGRLWSLLTSRRELRRAEAELRARGLAADIPVPEVERLLGLARQVHRLAFMATHFGEVRAVLSSWRYLHRWLALLMVLLAIVHVVTAVRFGEIDWGVLFGPRGAR